MIDFAWERGNVYCFKTKPKDSKDKKKRWEREANENKKI